MVDVRSYEAFVAARNALMAAIRAAQGKHDREYEEQHGRGAAVATLGLLDQGWAREYLEKEQAGQTITLCARLTRAAVKKAAKWKRGDASRKHHC